MSRAQAWPPPHPAAAASPWKGLRKAGAEVQAAQESHPWLVQHAFVSMSGGPAWNSGLDQISSAVCVCGRTLPLCSFLV